MHKFKTIRNKALIPGLIAASRLNETRDREEIDLAEVDFPHRSKGPRPLILTVFDGLIADSFCQGEAA